METSDQRVQAVTIETLNLRLVNSGFVEMTEPPAGPLQPQQRNGNSPAPWGNRALRGVRPGCQAARTGQRISLSASAKNSGPPKLPDFSASSIAPLFAPTARRTGTPAAISAPTRKPGIPKRSTTAPDV